MTIREQLERAAEIVGGKAWGLDKLKPRIYMPSRKDMKVYFEFPDCTYETPDDTADAIKQLGGACLKVFIDDCGQSPSWYSSQKKLVMDRQQVASLALCAYTLCDDDDLACKIMELEEIEDDTLNGAANHLVNGRAAEARSVLFGETQEVK